MTVNPENSSLPLLLVISGAVLLVAAGGWFFLEQEPVVPLTSEFEPPVTPASPGGETLPDAAPVEDPAVDLDAELLKAQLAAEADILVFPPAQSAIYYYGNILNVDPRHAIANAEMDAVLARVGQTVTDHLAAAEYEDAYDIAVIVFQYRPEHQLVLNTQRILDEQTEALVQQAIQFAQDGDDDAAITVLVEAESLPGRNPAYFTGIRASILEIQQVRQAAEEDRLRRSRLATTQARDAWVVATRNAIQQGNLISPAGANASDLLAEQNDWEQERAELGNELLLALVDTAQSHIDSRQPTLAAPLLDAAAQMEADQEVINALRSDVENLFADIQSSRVVQLEELVRVKTASPAYPRRAEERGQTGSVDVEFTVTIEGTTSNIVVVAADPESVFDSSAVAAVEKWEFEPREYRGRIIQQRATARLVFRIGE